MFVYLPFSITIVCIVLEMCHSFTTYTSSKLSKPAILSADLLEALRQQPTSTSRTDEKLDLETDLYDPSTGLHSEGVWHNALVGIASLQQPDQQRPSADALRLADSLFRYSWDRKSFCRRTWSGKWDHLSIDSNAPPVQANYYRESSEHRCVQHGMALIFWSKLCALAEDTKYKDQQRIIASSFIDEFWDSVVKRWTTISRSQGGGTTLRPSASDGEPALGLLVPEPYYRAVDQAIAVLACLELYKLVKDECERQKLENIIKTTTTELLSAEGFGYHNINESQTYIGLDRNRNFWHDGWTLLALICAREFIWQGSEEGQEKLQGMWKQMMHLYGHGETYESDDTGFDGTVWHWPKHLKTEPSNVRYCGDSALAFAIQRNLGMVNKKERADGFWDFLDTLRPEDSRVLLSVADAYPQVRLHPNTELAALLVWP